MEVAGLGGEVGFWRKALWLFISPRRCFEALRDEPDWLKPWLMSLAVAFACTFAVSYPAYLKSEPAAAGPREGKAGIAEAPSLDAPPKDAAASSQPDLAKAASNVIFILALKTLLALFMASGATHLLSMLFGHQGSFLGILPLWSYARLATIPEYLVALVLTKAGVSGLLAKPLSGGGLSSALLWVSLAQFNPFFIWQLALLLVGLMVIRRMKRMRAVAAAATLWVLWCGLSLLAAATQAGHGQPAA